MNSSPLTTRCLAIFSLALVQVRDNGNVTLTFPDEGQSLRWMGKVS